jgi:hypothetical protein
MYLLLTFSKLFFFLLVESLHRSSLSTDQLALQRIQNEGKKASNKLNYKLKQTFELVTGFENP